MLNIQSYAESEESSQMNGYTYRSEETNSKAITTQQSRQLKVPENVKEKKSINKLDQNKALKAVHQSLIDLYLDVKVRSNEEIVNLNDEQLEKEQSRLMDVDTLSLVEYIKTSIEILLNLKMETSMTHQSNKHMRQNNKQNMRIDTDNTSQLDHSQLTNSSNCTQSNGMMPPKAYEEIIQKLENDIRSHIRVEQQMKIAMEALQQKIEDKDRERSKIKNEYKQYIQELKQDKKRYVQLLELRDQELETLNERLTKFERNEKEYQSRLEELGKQLEEYKQRKRSTSNNRDQMEMSRSLERPSMVFTNNGRASILPGQNTLNTSGSNLKKKQYLKATNDTSRVNERQRKSRQSLVRKSLERESLINSQSMNALLTLKVNNTQSHNKNMTTDIQKLRNGGNKKQSFLIGSMTNQQRTNTGSTDISHRKNKSSNYSSTQLISNLKGITAKSKHKRSLDNSKQNKHQQLYQPTTLTVSLANTQPITEIDNPSSLASFSLLSLQQKQSTQNNSIEQRLHSNDDSFGQQTKQCQEIEIISQGKNYDIVSSSIETKTIPKNRASSSGNTTNYMIVNSSRLRSKENNHGNKFISSKRKAAKAQGSLENRNSISSTDFIHGKLSHQGSSLINSRVLIPSISINNLGSSNAKQAKQSQMNRATTSLYNKLFLTNRK